MPCTSGQKRIPPEIAAELADHATEDDLSPREIEVLRLVATGNGNREIAAKLSITEETVKNHVTHILAKLGANDRTHAVTIGIKRGFIELVDRHRDAGNRIIDQRLQGSGGRISFLPYSHASMDQAPGPIIARLMPKAAKTIAQD